MGDKAPSTKPIKSQEELNLFGKPIVADFLQKLGQGKSGEAYRMINDGDIIIMDKGTFAEIEEVNTLWKDAAKDYKADLNILLTICAGFLDAGLPVLEHFDKLKSGELEGEDLVIGTAVVTKMLKPMIINKVKSIVKGNTTRLGELTALIKTNPPNKEELLKIRDEQLKQLELMQSAVPHIFKMGQFIFNDHQEAMMHSLKNIDWMGAKGIIEKYKVTPE